MNTKTLIFFVLALTLFIGSCKNAGTPATDTTTDTTTTLKEWTPEDTRSFTGYSAKRGLITSTDAATPGYVLFSPAASTATYLLNKQGEIVHQWNGEFNSMQAYLKENGNLVRVERDPDFLVFAAGGQAGRIREYNWDGELLWDFEYADEKNLIHHDIALMPNGHILAISYDAKTREEAIAAGRSPGHTAPAGVWPDKVIEIAPTLPSGGQIVWEWHMWDHLVQDLDPSKDNYGIIAEQPRKLNLNPFNPEEPLPPAPPKEMIEQLKQSGSATANKSPDNWHSDISHFNAIYYNEDLDQIAISSPEYSEIFIIDHSTTTEEARGSSGGRWGHGGDLLYRWGNPQNYGKGTKEDRKLYYQHDVRWIPEGYPGAGHLMVFNNDNPGPDTNRAPNFFVAAMQAPTPDAEVSIADISNYSALYEIVPEVDDTGAYTLSENGKFGPDQPVWTYTAPDKYSFYSAFVSGGHRLSNGHTMILNGSNGRSFEIDQSGNIVWEYWNPYNDNYLLPDGTFAQPMGMFIFAQFRIHQYASDYAAFNGKELTPIQPQPEPYQPEPIVTQ